MDEPSEGLRTRDHRESDRRLREGLEAEGPRADPDRAEPRRRDRDRRAACNSSWSPARIFTETDRRDPRSSDADAQRRYPRSRAARARSRLTRSLGARCGKHPSSRVAAFQGKEAHDANGRTRRNARHERLGVRVPRATGFRTHGASTWCWSTRASYEPSRLTTPDITREEVAAAAGADVKDLAAAGDRGRRRRDDGRAAPRDHARGCTREGSSTA